MWINKLRKEKGSGFTLIELLIVVAIIGILAALAGVSYAQARRRTRDTKRVSDMSQLRQALVLYSNQRGTYPPAVGQLAQPLTLGAESAQCLDDSDLGFHSGNGNDSCGGFMIMPRVPAEIVAGYPAYQYTKTETSYTLTFTLEGALGDLPGGVCTASPEGVQCAP